MVTKQGIKDISLLTRFLVSFYVNVWVPIRLSYLRLKIKVIPYVRPTIVFITFFIIMISIIPIALIMLSGFLLTLLGHVILKVICYPFDIAADQEPGSAYASLTSASINAIVSMSRLGEEEDECEEEEPEKEEDVVRSTMDFIDKVSSEIVNRGDSIDDIPEPVIVPIPNLAGVRDETRND